MKRDAPWSFIESGPKVVVQPDITATHSVEEWITNPQKSQTCDWPTAIVVLGASNDSAGKLSAVAISRARTALAKYRTISRCGLLLTGGYGQHFNTTKEPHVYYLARYLRRNGVRAADIMGLILSSNTIEDALMVRDFLRKSEVRMVYIVTSDFHCERATFIFSRLFPKQRLRFVQARTDVSAKEFRRLHEHEAAALHRLRLNPQLLVSAR